MKGGERTKGGLVSVSLWDERWLFAELNVVWYSLLCVLCARERLKRERGCRETDNNEVDQC